MRAWMPAIHAGMTAADGEQFSSEAGPVSDGDFFLTTAETLRKEFFPLKYSELCVLCASDESSECRPS